MGRAGHGRRAELLRYLRRPPGPAASLLLPILPGVLPQLPSALVALTHRCHQHRVVSGLRTVHCLRGNGGWPLPVVRVGDSGLEGSIGSSDQSRTSRRPSYSRRAGGRELACSGDSIPLLDSSFHYVHVMKLVLRCFIPLIRRCSALRCHAAYIESLHDSLKL